MNAKINAAIRFMETNLQLNLSLNELASLVGLSRSHLYYLFKAQTGMSPLQYLKFLRMQKACELLETSLLSIKEITAKTGFKDESHFLRDFKKAYGVTPSQYRAQYYDPT